jgi:hypothetical protein
LHFGDHNLNCAIGHFDEEGAYQRFVQEINAAFSKADIPEVLRLMDKELGSAYSLKSLFRDDRRTILNQIVSSSLEEAEAGYRQIYENNLPLAHFLKDLGVPLPKAIRTAAEFAVNSQLREAFADDQMDLEQIHRLLEEARSADIALDSTTLEYTLRLTIERIFDRFEKEPLDLGVLRQLHAMVEMAGSLPFEVVLWTPQNTWAKLRRIVLQEPTLGLDFFLQDASAWRQEFIALGKKLQMHVPDGDQAALAKSAVAGLLSESNPEFQQH